MSYSEKHQEVSYNWHVLYTRYLERIIEGSVTLATNKEIEDAEEWQKVQDAKWEKIWFEQYYKVPKLSKLKARAARGGL